MSLQNFDQYSSSEVNQFEFVVISKDMTSIKNILQQWHAKSKNKQINKNLFVSFYKFVMKRDDVFIASYLIKQKININESHFNFVMNNKSFQFLKCFLDHDFDINKSRSYIDSVLFADTFDDEKTIR